MLDPDDPRHGTENGYNNGGCRCVLCRRAHTEYTYQKLAKRAEKLGLCTNCEENGQYAKGLCRRCLNFENSTGQNWTPEVRRGGVRL